MIRLLFRVTSCDGASALHSAEVHGSKSALLLDTPNVEIIGFEDCRDQDIPIRVKDERLFGHWLRNQWGVMRPGGVSATWKNEGDGGIPIPPHLAPEIERAFKDSDRPDVVYTPGEPEILCGGAEDVRDQKIPSPESIGLGGTAMDYRDLYEQREVLPGVFEARGKPATNPDGIPWIHRRGTKPDLSQVSLDALKDEIALRELVKKREENPPDKPVSEIGPDGGFLIPPEIAKQLEAEFEPAGPAGHILVDDPGAQEPPNPESVAEFFRETLASRRKKAEEEAGEDPRVLHGNGLHTKLWLLLRQNGEFVKSTTEEGGESYIACTSLDEAQKVAEQQKIYDIECVPHRVF